MKKQTVRTTLLLKLALASLLAVPASLIYANSLSSASAPGIPSNAVVAFDGPCPSGWSSYSRANGRAILGSGRLSQSYRGQNYNRTYTRGEQGGYRAYRLNSSEIPSNAKGNVVERKSCSFRDPSSCYDNKASHSAHSGYGAAFDNQGPYVVLNYCKKQ